jgi:hypothetical protein
MISLWDRAIGDHGEAQVGREGTFRMDSKAQRFRVNEPSIVSETIDGEVVIISLDSGSYYSLRGSGAEIWGLIGGGAGTADLLQRLGALYRGDGEEMRAHLERFLSQLVAEEILRVEQEGQSAAAAATAASRPEDPRAERPFEAPLLEKFTDMEHLLLLDPIHEVDEAGWPNVK